MYDSIAKEKSPSNFFFANLGGGVRSSANLVELGRVCEWFQCDNQGRGGDDTPIWGCALQGRVCNAVQSGKMATNVTGAWSTGAVRWRNVHKSPEEARMWMNETLASGMVPYHHIVGGEAGLGEDRRALEPARQYFNWMAKHEPHFVNSRSIATIGVVMGQRTQLFHTPPRGTVMQQYIDGLYYALLEGRFFFDFVHEEKLSASDLSKYSALILPNTALLSDEQCRQIGAIRRGGRILLATFQTAAYPIATSRVRILASDVFGIRKARQRHRHDGKCVWRGSRGATTSSAASTGHVDPWRRESCADCSSDDPVLTVVPGYTAYPPELSYPDAPRTTEPAVVLRREAEAAWRASGRHRAHHVEVGTRSGAASAEYDPMGRG
jgi:hypothetical protein